MLAAAAAILIHPTNVFALLLPVAIVGYARREQLILALRTTSVSAHPWVLAALATIAAAATFTVWTVAPHLVGRLHGTDELGSFACNYLRFFSGSGIYEYISGVGLGAPGGESFAWVSTICNLAFAATALAALVGMYRRLASEGNSAEVDSLDAALVLGWFAMLAAFFVVAGPRAISPHFERYGICLIAPGVVVLARGLTWWLDQSGAAGRRAATVLLLAATIWAASFAWNYFACFRQTGGMSHATFRTAEVEPKLAALDLVRGASSPGEIDTIVCSSWWLYWPLAYLASDDPALHVVAGETCEPSLASEKQATQAPGANAGDTRQRSWFIEFAGSDDEDRVMQTLLDRAPNAERHVILDDAGRAILSVIGPAENFSKNY